MQYYHTAVYLMSNTKINLPNSIQLQKKKHSIHTKVSSSSSSRRNPIQQTISLLDIGEFLQDSVEQNHRVQQQLVDEMEIVNVLVADASYGLLIQVWHLNDVLVVVVMLDYKDQPLSHRVNFIVSSYEMFFRRNSSVL